MAAVSSTPTGAAALTPLSGSHGEGVWDYPGAQSEVRINLPSADRCLPFLRVSPPLAQQGSLMKSIHRRHRKTVTTNLAPMNPLAVLSARRTATLCLLPTPKPATILKWLLAKRIPPTTSMCLNGINQETETLGSPRRWQLSLDKANRTLPKMRFPEGTVGQKSAAGIFNRPWAWSTARKIPNGFIETSWPKLKVKSCKPPAS